MFKKVIESLRKNGFKVSVFADHPDAVTYLDEEIDDMTVGIGGSHTVAEIGLYDRLSTHNVVWWNASRKHTTEERDKLFKDSMTADIYITSANALAETGEIVNIDARGNRVAASLYGHKKVYFIIGRNKLAKDLPSAIDRARNIASPKNCQGLGKKTPCAKDAIRCYDCSSEERLCNALVVLWKKMMGMEMEVILIDDDLGY